MSIFTSCDNDIGFGAVIKAIDSLGNCKLSDRTENQVQKMLKPCSLIFHSFIPIVNTQDVIIIVIFRKHNRILMVIHNV